jgi:ribosomal protein L11 methyltransferase
MNDSWSLVDFTVQRSEVELVSDTLWGLGVVAIEERNHLSDFTVLRTSMGDDPSDAIAAVTHAFPSLHAEIVQVPRAVADTWRQYATPTRVNDSLFLVPAWLQPDTSHDYLLIEPLDTFGLGNHPTTVLALRLALHVAKPHSSVFDLGCGSGVLAVGLAKFRSCTAQAFDIADSAKEAVRLNSELNNVHTVEWREGIGGTQSDVVLANILSPVLIAESNNILNGTRVGGVIVLSGMRDEQVAQVIQHFTDCEEIERESLDGWTAVALRKLQ